MSKPADEEESFFVRGSIMDQIDELRARALETGLSERRLRRLCQVVTAFCTPPDAVRSLLGCMLPAAQVPKDVVTALSGALCSQELSLEVKRDILRWLAAVFHTLDPSCNRVLLTRVLLGFLETPLCADAVSLLVLLASKTTASSFTMSRIAKASKRRPSNELDYLAFVLKRCRSGSVPLDDAQEKKLEALGLAWQAHMHQLQQHFFGSILYECNPERSGLWCVDPSAGIEQVAEAIERGALDLKTFLLNPEIQRFISSKSGGRLQVYFDTRLRMVLNDVFWNQETADGKQFLEMLISAINAWQEIPPVVEQWLTEVVGLWDGEHYWKQMLALISFSTLSSPGLFFLRILEPLLQLLFFLELEKQGAAFAYAVEEFGACLRAETSGYFGKELFVSLASMKVFRCLCDLCRFWGLVEVPRAKGERELSLFGRTYDGKPMSAMQQLIGHVGRIGVALLQLHPDHVIEVMGHVFDLHRMRLDIYNKTGVTMLSALPWPVLVYSVYSHNALLLDGISKVCLSQQALLGQLKLKYPQPWLQQRIQVSNAQVLWLGNVVTGTWEDAREFGPCLPPAALKAADLIPSKRGDWPVALWWQPALHEEVSKLCHQYRVGRHRVIQVAKVWRAFLTILASSQSHTAELMMAIVKGAEK